MGVFLAIISKGECIEQEVQKIAQSQILEQHLHIEFTDYKCYMTQDKKACLFNYARPSLLYKVQEQYYEGEEGVIAFQGNIIQQVKVLTEIDFLGAKDLFEEVSNQPYEQFKEKYTGDYSLIKLTNSGDLIAFNDTLGMEHIYYYEKENRIYLSNRVRLIRCLLEQYEINIEALSYIPYVGNIIGNETPIKGINRIPQNSYLIYKANGDKRSLEIHEKPLYMFEKQAGMDNYETFLRENVNVCINRLAAAIKKTDRIAFGLTGGKDSRLLLGMMIKAGVAQQVPMNTHGYTDHPDVIVAKALAEHYHLNHEFRERGAAKHFEDTNIFRNLMTSVFQTDGAFGCWDATPHIIPNNRLVLPGHASELFKSFSGWQVINNYEDSLKFYDNRANYPLIIKPELRARLRDKIVNKVNTLEACGISPADTVDAFKVIDRMPNWIGYLLRSSSYAETQLQILNNDNLIRLAYISGYDQRAMQRLHFEIMHYTDKWLVEQPFANQVWSTKLEPYAKGLNIRSKEVPIPKGMPFYGSWQHKINQSENFKIKVWDMLTSYDSSEFWNFYDRRLVEKQILKNQFSFLELIGLYGFLGIFMFYHQIELPNKIRLPEGERGKVAKTFIRVKENGAKGYVGDNNKVEVYNALTSQRISGDTKEVEPIEISEIAFNFLTLDKAGDLSKIIDLNQYLETIDNEKLIIYMTIRDNASLRIKQATIEAMKKLNLAVDLSRYTECSYLAVLARSVVVYEEVSKDTGLSYKGNVEGMAVEIESASYKTGNKGLITVDGKDYRNHYRGLGIVVYDCILKKVVDHVTFDIFAEGKAYR